MLNIYQSKSALMITKHFANIKSIESIISSSHETPGIRSMANTNEALLMNTLKLMFVDLAKAFNFQQNLNGGQIDEIVATIITDEDMLKYLKIEDIYMVCKEIKTGKRDMYQCLDVQVVLSQINDYIDRKIHIAEKYHLGARDRANKLEKINDDAKGITADPSRMISLFDRVLAKFKPKLENKTESTPNPTNPQLVESEYLMRMRQLMPELDIDSLYDYRANYVKENYKVGIDMVDDELIRREMKKTTKEFDLHSKISMAFNENSISNEAGQDNSTKE